MATANPRCYNCTRSYCYGECTLRVGNSDYRRMVMNMNNTTYGDYAAAQQAMAGGFSDYMYGGHRNVENKSPEPVRTIKPSKRCIERL